MTFIQICEYYDLLPLPLVGVTLWKAHKSDISSFKCQIGLNSPALDSIGKYFFTCLLTVRPLAREDRECLSQNIANILARITPSFHQLIAHSGQQPYSKFFLTFTALPPPSMKSSSSLSLFPTSGESHVSHKITLLDSNFLKNLIQL